MHDKDIVDYIKDSEDEPLTSLIADYFDFENRIIDVDETEIDYLENLKVTIETLLDDARYLVGEKNVSS